MGNRDEFSPKTKRKVAERAAFICSNPSCNQVTIGPSESDQQKSAKVGIAAHICAASSRGPRYDMSQTLGQRKGIKNAIWLCPSCAMLVDKNGGDDYPADHLRKWKRDHETLIKKCLEGDKRIAVKLRGDTTPATKQNAKRIMDLLKHRGALFKGYSQEDPSHVIASLDKLRGKLTEIRRDLAPESQLDIVAGSIVDACRHYMNTTSDQAGLKELEYSLGAVRKIVGLNVRLLVEDYGLAVPSNLEDMMPQM